MKETFSCTLTVSLSGQGLWSHLLFFTCAPLFALFHGQRWSQQIEREREKHIETKQSAHGTRTPCQLIVSCGARSSVSEAIYIGEGYFAAVKVSYVVQEGRAEYSCPWFVLSRSLSNPSANLNDSSSCALVSLDNFMVRRKATSTKKIRSRGTSKCLSARSVKKYIKL